MVIDDDPAIAAALEMGLTLAGHQVVLAHDGHTGYALLHTPPTPDVLVVDLLLPGISGRRLVEHMAADPELCRIPVIIATATADQEFLPPPGTYRTILRKPFDLSDALEAVGRALTQEQADETA